MSEDIYDDEVRPHNDGRPTQPAGQPTEARVEQRHRDLAKHILTGTGCSLDAIIEYEAKRIADFEASAVEEARQETWELACEMTADIPAIKAENSELRMQRTQLLNDAEDAERIGAAALIKVESLKAQLAQAEAERDALAKKLSDQSMSVLVDVDKFDEIQAKADRCEQAEAALAQVRLAASFSRGVLSIVEKTREFNIEGVTEALRRIDAAIK
jgi:hypothetical protein